MKKVLIVESDDQVADSTAAMVNALGYEAIIHRAGDILAVSFIEISPDLVIIYRKLFLKNRQLFIENGYKLSDASLIVTSGAYLTPERIKELGADYFLHKPYSEQDLKTILNHYKERVIG